MVGIFGLHFNSGRCGMKTEWEKESMLVRVVDGIKESEVTKRRFESFAGGVELEFAGGRYRISFGHFSDSLCREWEEGKVFVEVDGCEFVVSMLDPWERGYFVRELKDKINSVIGPLSLDFDSSYAWRRIMVGKSGEWEIVW